jgi:hypothetical protein
MALALLGHGAVFAQDEPGRPQPDPNAQARFEALVAQIQDFQKRHSITVNGAENPAAIQRGVLLEMFFSRFRAVDDVSFAQFALETVGATGSDAEVLKEAQSIPTTKPSGDICARVLDGSLADGLDIATVISAFEAESEQDAAAHYQNIIDRLSPRVRANVSQRMDDEVVHISSTNLDHLGMALEDPDLYRTMTKGYCRGQRKANANPSAVRNQSPFSNDMAR